MKQYTSKSPFGPYLKRLSHDDAFEVVGPFSLIPVDSADVTNTKTASPQTNQAQAQAKAKAKAKAKASPSNKASQSEKKPDGKEGDKLPKRAPGSRQ